MTENWIEAQDAKGTLDLMKEAARSNPLVRSFGYSNKLVKKAKRNDSVRFLSLALSFLRNWD